MLAVEKGKHGRLTYKIWCVSNSELMGMGFSIHINCLYMYVVCLSNSTVEFSIRIIQQLLIQLISLLLFFLRWVKFPSIFSLNLVLSNSHPLVRCPLS